METQHTLSPGLLVSVSPEGFHALHLDGGDKGGEFDRKADEAKSFLRITLDYLRAVIKKP